ncbi:hypothetical protein [Candidatus Nitronereus thalassa]|uniref:Uncharacterized protein n=1 Tax=Candidatus Nitronereus thalassa TaxID=3020898 RepID=A0ABU3K7U4_9BACT|nr:hypothetical protein [Candidatus Nitronereus thalassa]MDT7042453.1 hypothetical protein [Candidatus Nitronereus thalassa]
MPKMTRLHHRKPAANWLEVTHQMWKLYMALLGFGTALLCFLSAGLSLLLGTSLFSPLMVIGLVAGGGTFAWFVQSLRCPSCRTSLVWAMIRTRSHMSWLVDLANLATCPSCQVALTQRPSARWRAIY